MAKLTSNGVTIEGTPEELAAIMKQFTVEADVVEPEEVAEVEIPKFKIGEEVRLTSIGNSPPAFVSGFTIGDICVIKAMGAKPGRYEISKEGNRGYASDHHLELVAEEPDVQFETGDKVRINNNGEFGGVEVGDIGTVSESDTEDGDPYSVRVDGDDGDHDYFRPQDIELISEEQAEVDAIERKRTEVFTANSRKVNEYREGDIVRALKSNSFGGIPGKVYEVADAQKGGISGGNLRMKCGAISLAHSTEIVTFVENRLDRN